MLSPVDELLNAINDFRAAEAVLEYAGDCADERDLADLDCTRRVISMQKAGRAIQEATAALEAATAFIRAETHTLRVTAAKRRYGR